MNGRGGDAGVAERGVELRVGLRVGFQQRVDLPDHFRAVVFGLVPTAGGEVVEAADAGAEFAETGFDRVPPPAEDLFGVAGFALAVLQGHLSLKLPTAKASQLASGRENDASGIDMQVLSHDCVPVLEVTTGRKPVAAIV